AAIIGFAEHTPFLAAGANDVRRLLVVEMVTEKDLHERKRVVIVERIVKLGIKRNAKPRIMAVMVDQSLHAVDLPAQGAIMKADVGCHGMGPSRARPGTNSQNNARNNPRHGGKSRLPQ